MTQIVADETVLANAIEWTKWNQPGVQLIVCEQCGTDGCASGGWVVPRWTGSHVILLPDFASMAEDEWALDEYRPPDYFGPRGIPILGEAVAKTIPAFQWPHELALITGQELVWAIQWTAPMNILGRFPEPPRVRRDDVIATSESDLGSALDHLEAQIAREESNIAETVLGPRLNAAQLVSFYLDDLGGTEWVPGVNVEGEIALALDTDLVVTSSGELFGASSSVPGVSW